MSLIASLMQPAYTSGVAHEIIQGHRDSHITKDYTWDELLKSETALRRGIDNTPGPIELYNLERLVDNVLQPLRSEYVRGPVMVSSGFRCDELNDVIGGQIGSEHTKGCAADITPLTEMTPAQLFRMIVNVWLHEGTGLPFNQIILEFGRWVHISHNPVGHQLGKVSVSKVGSDGKTKYRHKTLDDLVSDPKELENMIRWV